MTVVSPPAVDPEHMADLTARGNTLRGARKEIKRGLRDRTLCPVQLLRDPPEAIQGMRVFEFLEAVPWVGQKRIRDLNVAAVWAGVNMMKPVGALTARQTEWLLRNALPAACRPAVYRRRS